MGWEWAGVGLESWARCVHKYATVFICIHMQVHAKQCAVSTSCDLSRILSSYKHWECGPCTAEADTQLTHSQ